MSTTWIFQANPKRYRISEFLETSPSKCKWLARQHQNDIRIGDRVFLWRAIGGKERSKAGIVADAEVIGPVLKQLDDSQSAPFWLSEGEATAFVDRVELRILRIARPGLNVRYDVIREDPILSMMAVMTLRNRTNFKLSEDHAERVSLLWDKSKS